MNLNIKLCLHFHPKVITLLGSPGECHVSEHNGHAERSQSRRVLEVNLSETQDKFFFCLLFFVFVVVGGRLGLLLRALNFNWAETQQSGWGCWLLLYSIFCVFVLF